MITVYDPHTFLPTLSIWSFSSFPVCYMKAMPNFIYIFIYEYFYLYLTYIFLSICSFFAFVKPLCLYRKTSLCLFQIFFSLLLLPLDFFIETFNCWFLGFVPYLKRFHYTKIIFKKAQLLFYFKAFMFTFCHVLFCFWPCHMTCEILVPQPGIKPVSPAVEAQSPNHCIPGKSTFFNV